jgi:hypothetical protein
MIIQKVIIGIKVRLHMQYNKTDYMQSNQNLESTNLYIQPSTNNTIKNREQYKKERKKKKAIKTTLIGKCHWSF